MSQDTARRLSDMFTGVKLRKLQKEDLEDIDGVGCVLLWLDVFAKALKDRDYKYFFSDLFKEDLERLPDFDHCPYLNNVDWWRARVREEAKEWLEILEMI